MTDVERMQKKFQMCSPSASQKKFLVSLLLWSYMTSVFTEAKFRCQDFIYSGYEVTEYHDILKHV